MLIELGNASPLDGIDDSPCVTVINMPDADENGQGGYTHEIGGVGVDEFRTHRQDALDYNGGTFHLPDHEILLSVANVWPTQSRKRPTWVAVTAGPSGDEDVAEDVESFLSEFYEIERGKPEDVEFTHHTRYGAPGVFPQEPRLPDSQMLFTNSGRVLANQNDGGGQAGFGGTGTAATATTLTTGQTMTANQWTGYRVYCMQTASGPLVWGNVLSNTTAGVLTIDRWYNPATPGGAAATTPSAGWQYILADGGQTSAWFIGMTTTASFAPAATDTIMSSEYQVGSPTGVAAGAGYIRKISPYAQTSGVASRSITLTPVFTGNTNDVYSQTFTGISANTSMVPGSVGCMKFETALNATATVAASGDQVTVTETITGS